MKNKITAILLSVACVCVSILPSALLSFNHVETEEVILEETKETPTWDILYKGNSDAMKAYQETYDRVYKETYENLTKTQEQVQANIQATNEVTQQNIQSFIQDMVNSDWYKLIQANNEKVVKDIDYDKNGNLVVKYSNGTQKSIAYTSTVIPTPSENDSTYSDFMFNDGGNGTELIEYRGSSYNVVIPSKCTKICDNVFKNKSWITNISIPNNVTYIGDWAFYYCTGLTSITIPNSVTCISYNAFNGCSNLTSINIPTSINKISSGSFSGCSRLTSINIPNGVTEIESTAFGGCSGLTSIIIPDSVTLIRIDAFAGCNNLTSITLSNNINTIQYGAFEGCTNLNSVTYKGVTYTDKTSLINALTTNGVSVDSSAFANTSL